MQYTIARYRAPLSSMSHHLGARYRNGGSDRARDLCIRPRARPRPLPRSPSPRIPLPRYAMALAASPVIDSAYEQALALLERVPLIDGHNDLPFVVRADRAAKGDLAAYDLGKVHPETDTDIPRMQAGRLAGQFFAAYVPPNHPKPAGFALAQITLMRRIRERHADVFRPGLSADDVGAAKKEGRIALFMTIENGSALDN
eukprot:gene32058-41264_t